jgi:polyphosphate kinase 2 (PPK2 family)
MQTNMKLKDIIKRARKLSKPFRVTDGDRFRLNDFDPGDTLDLKSEDKPRAKEALALGVEALAQLQEILYAQDKWAVLIIFQAMDAAGKDGAIKHVMGTSVSSTAATTRRHSSCACIRSCCKGRNSRPNS